MLDQCQKECIGQIIDSSKIERKYHKSENVISEKHYDKDGKLEMSITSTFDEKGNVMTRKTYDNKGEFVSHGEWEYDEKGKVIGERLYDENNKVTASYKIQYAKNGIPIRKEYDGSGQFVDNIEYKYDEEGNCIVRKSYSAGMSQVYDDNGNLISEERSEYELFTIEEYNYDDNGNLVGQKFYNNIGE